MSSSSQWRFVMLLLLGIGSLVFAGCYSDVKDFFEKEYAKEERRKIKVETVRKIADGRYEVDYRYQTCSRCGGRGTISETRRFPARYSPLPLAAPVTVVGLDKSKKGQLDREVRELTYTIDVACPDHKLEWRKETGGVLVDNAGEFHFYRWIWKGNTRWRTNPFLF